MKIAIVGTAPASSLLAPYGDTTWKIWGCAPGLYPTARRVDLWFELHRWEPPVIGNAQAQVPWFSPEYVQWLKQASFPIYVAATNPDLPTSRVLPWQDLTRKYGHYFFTSTIAWEMAMAIEAISMDRDMRRDGPPEGIVLDPPSEDWIGLWGVDMATSEEYGYQRAGCQFFAQIAASMGIKIYTPPESDLLIPPAMYGISENFHRNIKLRARRQELVQRKAMIDQQLEILKAQSAHMGGAIEDMDYHLGSWGHQGDFERADFVEIFGQPLPPQTGGEPPPPA